MKRKLEQIEENYQKRSQTTSKQFSIIGTKRSCIDSQQCSRKRYKSEEIDALRKRNFELQQMCNALIHKVQTLEYMLQMFRRNETVSSNRMVPAF